MDLLKCLDNSTAGDSAMQLDDSLHESLVEAQPESLVQRLAGILGVQAAPIGSKITSQAPDGSQCKRKRASGMVDPSKQIPIGLRFISDLS